MAESILDVVDEHGRVVGEASRSEIHRRGLLHREIHVWLFTPDGKIIFQLRGKHKDTFPNLLDASVGGHVERGMGFEDTALKELREETGIEAKAVDLRLLVEEHTSVHDPATDTTNNALRRVYAYCFRGNVATLKVETGESQGFEAWPIERLLVLTAKQKARFIAGFVEPEYFGIYAKIQRLVLEA